MYSLPCGFPNRPGTALRPHRGNKMFVELEGTIGHGIDVPSFGRIAAEDRMNALYLAQGTVELI